MNPVKHQDFGIGVHKYAVFHAQVSGRLSKAELEMSGMWSYVAGKMKAGDEVRCIADDCTFRAMLLCTYAQGTEARMKVVEYIKLDEVDYDALDAEASKYMVKLRGVKKWCIIKNETGEVIKELIPTQAEALRELAEYQKALAA